MNFKRNLLVILCLCAPPMLCDRADQESRLLPRMEDDMSSNSRLGLGFWLNFTWKIISTVFFRPNYTPVQNGQDKTPMYSTTAAPTTTKAPATEDDSDMGFGFGMPGMEMDEDMPSLGLGGLGDQ
ncbi:hypothetical protein Ciccas_012610 [Cichlidogyrus casuarinus]|uniref:Uncharacterized protein n=1 Tax=Cichlidogyrus casuarinus TaxID=1844966 RepID=A0ABD2PMW4_9PLAT